MSLSEISIHIEVELQTSAAIIQSNYENLRQLILAREPIPFVIQTISKQLNSLANEDKELFKNLLTHEACEDQKSSDIQEENHDALDREGDNRIILNSGHQLHFLATRQNGLDFKSSQQQNSLSQLRSLINEYKASAQGIEVALNTIRNQRSEINGRYSSIPMPGNVHTHAHQPVVAHSHKASGVYCYNDQDQLILNSLSHEENRLIAEQTRQATLVRLKEGEYLEAERILNDTLNELRDTKKRIESITYQLNTELPNKEQLRIIRQQERTARAEARQVSDPTLRQLSQSNYHNLQSKIATKNQELDLLQNQLETKAKELSYPEYLSQLEVALSHPDGPKISFHESDALKVILQMMKQYLEMEKTEQNLKNCLISEQSALMQLAQVQIDTSFKKANYINSNAHLQSDNERMRKENNELEQNINSAAKNRSRALYALLFAGGGTAVSTGIVFGLLLSPIFFAIPAAFGLTTLIALTTAVVCHFKKGSSESSVILNNDSIKQNEETLRQQAKGIKNIEEEILPDLAHRITLEKDEIGKTGQRLSQHQSAMDAHLNKMGNVTSKSGGDLAFFPPSTASSSYYPAPSAPEYNMDEDFKNGTYGTYGN